MEVCFFFFVEGWVSFGEDEGGLIFDQNEQNHFFFFFFKLILPSPKPTTKKTQNKSVSHIPGILDNHDLTEGGSSMH